MPKGHNTAVLLQHQKFEILLNSAANALFDGYTIEAASSFSSAHERFLEFATRVLCEKDTISSNAFGETFSQVKNFSERQIGAFLFLFLTHFGEAYKLNTKIKELRNKYIHQGYIPKPEEVTKFGEMIYTEIVSISIKLREKFSNEISNVVSVDLLAKQASVKSGVRIATTAGGNLFSLTDPTPESNFSVALERYKTRQTTPKRFS